MNTKKKSNRKSNKKQQGFSLIELLIVVAIILVIAAIAIPNLLSAKRAANESSAAASVRTIGTAQATYLTSYPASGYASSLAVLGPPTTDPLCSSTAPSASNACLIDTVLAAGTKSGFTFSSVGGTNQQFLSLADPVSSSTGQKHYCQVEDMVVRFNASAMTDRAGCGGGTPIGQ